jgi:hypothetical protein
MEAAPESTPTPIYAMADFALSSSGRDARLVANAVGEGKGAEGMGRGIQIDLAERSVRLPVCHLQPFRSTH